MHCSPAGHTVPVLSCLLFFFLLLKDVLWGSERQMTTALITQDEDEEDLAFMRKFVRPEEDLREQRRHHPWAGGYRYFKSENIVCIEHYRRSAQKQRPRGGAK